MKVVYGCTEFKFYTDFVCFVTKFWNRKLWNIELPVLEGMVSWQLVMFLDYLWSCHPRAEQQYKFLQ